MSNNELILVEDGESQLNMAASNQLACIEQQLKELKQIEDDLKERILAEMQAKGIIKLENEELSITYVAETYRESFDSKQLRKDDEDTYNKYIKISSVKPSLRVKTK